MAKGPISLLVDTDIFIDYLNGAVSTKKILDRPRHRCYYSAITQKELLAVPELSKTESTNILRLLTKHRSIAINNKIELHYSS